MGGGKRWRAAIRLRARKTKDDDDGGGLEARRLKECLMRQTSRVGAIISMGIYSLPMAVVVEEMAVVDGAARNRNSTGRNSGRGEI